MSIAGLLEENGFEVDIIDALVENITIENTVKKIIDFDPDVIGISTNISNFDTAEELCSRVKKLNNKIMTVLGGPYVTNKIDAVKNENVDYIIRGEAEFSFLKLIKKNGKWDSDIPGLTIYKNGKIISNPISLIENLDEIPIPAWHLVPLKKYRPSPVNYKKIPAIHMITSRGCPYDCIYCTKTTFGRKVRFFSVERVRSELEVLKNYGFKDISFWDDVFTLDKKRAMDISEELKNLNLKWNCLTRVDCIDKKTLETFSRNGCYGIGYGIESGSEKTQRFMKKGFSLNQARKAIELTKSYGIKVKLLFMIGFPDETKEDIMKTINFAKEQEPDFTVFSIVTPLPGTELFEMVKDDIPDTSKNSFSYHSMNFSINKNFSYEELIEFQKLAYRKFYMRPSYMYKQLRNIRSFLDIKRDIRGLLSVLNFQI